MSSGLHAAKCSASSGRILRARNRKDRASAASAATPSTSTQGVLPVSDTEYQPDTAKRLSMHGSADATAPEGRPGQILHIEIDADTNVFLTVEALEINA